MSFAYEVWCIAGVVNMFVLCRSRYFLQRNANVRNVSCTPNLTGEKHVKIDNNNNNNKNENKNDNNEVAKSRNMQENIRPSDRTCEL